MVNFVPDKMPSCLCISLTCGAKICYANENPKSQQEYDCHFFLHLNTSLKEMLE